MPRKREACILQDHILDRLRKSLFEHHHQEQLPSLSFRTLPNYDEALPAIARKIIGFPDTLYDGPSPRIGWIKVQILSRVFPPPQ